MRIRIIGFGIALMLAVSAQARSLNPILRDLEKMVAAEPDQDEAAMARR